MLGKINGIKQWAAFFLLACLQLVLVAGCQPASDEKAESSTPETGAAEQRAVNPTASANTAMPKDEFDQTQLLAAAEAGLDKFLPRIPPGRESLYGFASRDDFSNAEIGTPHRVYTLDREFLTGASAAESIRVSALPEWRIPILVKDKPVALVTVAYSKGSYRAVDFGAAGLAREIGRMNDHLQLPADSTQPVLLRLHLLKADFLGLIREGSPAESLQLYPMQSAAMALNLEPFSPSRSYDLQKLMPAIVARSAKVLGVEGGGR